MKKIIWYITCFTAGVLLSVAINTIAKDDIEEDITDTAVEQQYQEIYKDSPIEGVVLEPVDE